jgi:hypothetical protein
MAINFSITNQSGLIPQRLKNKRFLSKDTSSLSRVVFRSAPQTAHLNCLRVLGQHEYWSQNDFSPIWTDDKALEKLHELKAELNVELNNLLSGDFGSTLTLRQVEAFNEILGKHNLQALSIEVTDAHQTATQALQPYLDCCKALSSIKSFSPHFANYELYPKYVLNALKEKLVKMANDFLYHSEEPKEDLFQAVKTFNESVLDSGLYELMVDISPSLKTILSQSPALYAEIDEIFSEYLQGQGIEGKGFKYAFVLTNHLKMLLMAQKNEAQLNQQLQQVEKLLRKYNPYFQGFKNS